MQLRRFVAGAALAGAVGISGAQEAVSPADIEFFEREVRPLLAEHCYGCHGQEKQKGGLRLDHITFALQGGDTGPAFIPGKADESRLLEAVNYDNVDLQMPPKEKLSTQAIETLTKWIAMGSPWPDEPVPEGGVQRGDTVGSVKNFDLEERRANHWAWQAIQAQSPPNVQHANWPNRGIDNFLLAKLEENGLSPAPDADKYTMIRRLYFDLTGLPPTPEAIEAYVNDESPDAYSNLVDELLASPAFGERWARHWMDVTRYAETHGHEGDYPILHAWRYRDYMIRAFNQDIPYDQLIREHLAGDLLENPRINEETGTNESILGTGFLYMHQATHAPVDAKKDFLDRMDNGIDVISKGFLGMTVACARCHQHPFDAISTQDYYALVGALRSTRQVEGYLDPHGKNADGAAKMRDIHAATTEHTKTALQRWIDEDSPQIADYLDGVREVMFGEWKIEDGVETLAPEIVFDDFEDGFTKWFVEGEAFADGPIAGPAIGFKGKAAAVSHLGTDELEGKLTSRPFVIERRFVHFLIGGGDNQNQLAVRLVIDGETERESTGQRSNRMRQERWDVTDLLGRTATIEVVDNGTGAWGQITVDHIVFSNSQYAPGTIRRPIDAVAEEGSLDQGKLARWIDSLTTGVEGSPLESWLELARVSEDDLENVIAEKTKAASEPDEFVLYEDFSGGSIDGWFREGEAFNPGIAPAGSWVGADHHIRFTSGDMVHSGLVSNRLKGTLRTPTFTLTHDNIHFRLSGWGAKVRLVVEGYQLRPYNGILFSQTLFNVNSPNNFYWHNMTRDLSKFKGSRAYIEFIDDGDGFIIVDEIRFSDGNPPAKSNQPMIANLDRVKSQGSLARAIEREAVNAARNIVEGTSTYDESVLLGWLAERDLISGSDLRVAAANGRDSMNFIANGLPGYVRATIATEGTPERSPYLIRGNHSTPGEEVPRRFLEALAGKDQPQVDGSGRLEITNRLLADSNPLPSRVAVNRVWHHLFGVGIVPTTDNFGVTGDEPTHPELLDYLAAKFRDEGWSVKNLVREIVHTRAYRMTSQPLDKLAEEQDPANKLLHRMRVRRLQGEAIRDAVLASAGTLDPQMYGESVPIYLSPFMSYHRRPAKSGPMDGDHRRTIYVEIRRNFLNPMLLAFDMPQPDSTVGRRTVSNVPAQALIMMNDPFIVQQAEAWAEAIAESEGDVTEKLEDVFLRALGRTPDDYEVERMLTFMRDQATTYELDAEEAMGDPRVWKDLCHVMYTLKEFVYVL